MPVKVILCRCEDVTLADLEHAVSLGYTHIEEAKRYTGLGTGPCQGKECLVPTCLYLAQATGEPPETIRPFTSRPPLAPVALGTLAGAADLGGEGQRGNNQGNKDQSGNGQGGKAPHGKEPVS
jgi:bacterioferritin-associated ferredoxin